MNVDYDSIAPFYDAHRRTRSAYLNAIVEAAHRARPDHVLELGAGTGAATQAFLQAFPCEITALDISRGMLSEARGKNLAANWVQASAEFIPLANGCMDFVFAVYLLHHIRDVARVFCECARVLSHGTAVFVTAPIGYIERHPMNRYFPSFASIDKARFQPEEVLQDAMRNAGFSKITSHIAKSDPEPIDEVYIRRIENKFVSTYSLLPVDEFMLGLEQIRRDVCARGRLEVDATLESLVITGQQ